jgi:hypothetical protein
MIKITENIIYVDDRKIAYDKNIKNRFMTILYKKTFEYLKKNKYDNIINYIKNITETLFLLKLIFREYNEFSDIIISYL